MKRIIAAVLSTLVAAAVFAQELTVSGELKTGFYMEQETIGKQNPAARGGMKNTDGDSGSGEARIRLDFHLSYQNIGLRTQFQIEPVGEKMPQPGWPFAYAYGNFFDEQLKVSGGLLGESPWATEGPRLKVEPESRDYGYDINLGGHQGFANLAGIRFEYKPAFAPGLNLGFVLNQADMNLRDVKEQTFGDFLKETVVGIAYEHDYFAVRAAYRFDSDLDVYLLNRQNEGGRLIYHVEERVLSTVADGMRIWVDGYYYGLGAAQNQPVYFQNWLYWLWDSVNFIAGLDVNFSMYARHTNIEYPPVNRGDYQELQFIPSFYYKFFGDTLRVGLGLGFGMELGDGKTWKNAPYQYIFVEPQIRFNMSANAYLALVYNFTDSYAYPTTNNLAVFGDKSVKHLINLRAVYVF